MHNVIKEVKKAIEFQPKINELFDYDEIPSYMKSRKYSEKDKDDYEMSL